MKRKKLAAILLFIMMGMLTACGDTKQQENVADAIVQEEGTEAEASETTGCTLEELTGLLGMEDEKTAGLFGGGEENWTEDGSFYIGRIYEITLFEETFPMFTSCDDEKIVNAVSVWLANGEGEVKQETVAPWVERITEYTAVEPSYYEATSESGSKNWKWVFDGKVISLSWLGDILSIGMNPAVGELK